MKSYTHLRENENDLDKIITAGAALIDSELYTAEYLCNYFIMLLGDSPVISLEKNEIQVKINGQHGSVQSSLITTLIGHLLRNLDKTDYFPKRFQINQLRQNYKALFIEMALIFFDKNKYPHFWASLQVQHALVYFELKLGSAWFYHRDEIRSKIQVLRDLNKSITEDLNTPMVDILEQHLQKNKKIMTSSSTILELSLKISELSHTTLSSFNNAMSLETPRPKLGA